MADFLPNEAEDRPNIDEVPDVSDAAFVDPFDRGVFNEDAAAKYPEWERMVADSEKAVNDSIAALDGLGDDELNYIASFGYEPFMRTTETEGEEV